MQTSMTFPQARQPRRAAIDTAAVNPGYPCSICAGWHSSACPAAALGQLLARLAREADDRVPAERRTRRTLGEMMPGYERQPVLVLHRPEMNDACPLCGMWSCTGKCAPYPGIAGGAIAKAVSR